ncbi:hypothetical protein JCM10212_000041 [Sporobolomyces blumeae]
MSSETESLASPVYSPNEDADVDSDDESKPSPPAELTPFYRNGVKHCTVGTLCTPELVEAAAKDAHASRTPPFRAFANLPTDVVDRIIDWVVELETEVARRNLQDADWTGTGRLKGADAHFAVANTRARHSALKRLELVNRLFYHLTLPRLFGTIDLSGVVAYRVHTYLYNFEVLFPQKVTIAIEKPPVANGTVGQGPSPARNKATLLAPPPRKKRKVPKKTDVADPSPASSSPGKSAAFSGMLGELVKSFHAPPNATGYQNLLNYFLPVLPNLEHIFFNPKFSLDGSYLRLLAQKATYTFRTVDGVHLDSLASDAASHAENIIALFNGAPNIERFGVSGGLVLDELRGKRLAFIWRLNSRFKHAPTGTLGHGLKRLHFGQGVEFTVGFLRSLPEAVPNVTELHIGPGVKIVADSTPTGLVPFDLTAAVDNFKKLTALTLVGTDTFGTSGNLDAILRVCPVLKRLHLRADHVTIKFFQVLAVDLSDVPNLPSPSLAADESSSGRASTSSGPVGVATPASAQYLQASQLATGSSDPERELKHPLAHLSITCRVGEQASDKTNSRIRAIRAGILPLALLVMSFKARGLDYPDEIGGQRDMLVRAALIVSLEEKRRQRAQEQNCSKGKQEKGKGKNKGKAVAKKNVAEKAATESETSLIELCTE